MRVNGTPTRSIQRDDDGVVRFIDQRWLPHRFERVPLDSLDRAVTAIADMWVRGAPLIGATAAWGTAVAMTQDPSDAGLSTALERLANTRPTAVNLQWALDQMRQHLSPLPPGHRARAAAELAQEICDWDVECNSALGNNGLALIEAHWDAIGRPTPFHILTHCNAGWLATVDWGTALAPIFKAHESGLPVHVWVDETRPRNQGARLTAWELDQQGIPHTVISDNAGGHLMQNGQVHAVIVGTDRTTRNGDVANKIGTYLKALAAHDNGIPFWVALPSSTIDWNLDSGADIPIEERSAAEVTHIQGKTADGQVLQVQLTPDNSPAANPAFDVTPARLVTALITERGAVAPTEKNLTRLFREDDA